MVLFSPQCWAHGSRYILHLFALSVYFYMLSSLSLILLLLLS